MAKRLSATIRGYYPVVLSVTLVFISVFTLIYVFALISPEKTHGFYIQLVPTWLESLVFAVVCSILVGFLVALIRYAKGKEHYIQEMLNRK